MGRLSALAFFTPWLLQETLAILTLDTDHLDEELIPALTIQAGVGRPFKLPGTRSAVRNPGVPWPLKANNKAKPYREKLNFGAPQRVAPEDTRDLEWLNTIDMIKPKGRGFWQGLFGILTQAVDRHNNAIVEITLSLDWHHEARDLLMLLRKLLEPKPREDSTQSELPSSADASTAFSGSTVQFAALAEVHRAVTKYHMAKMSNFTKTLDFYKTIVEIVLKGLVLGAKLDQQTLRAVHFASGELKRSLVVAGFDIFLLVNIYAQLLRTCRNTLDAIMNFNPFQTSMLDNGENASTPPVAASGEVFAAVYAALNSEATTQIREQSTRMGQQMMELMGMIQNMEVLEAKDSDVFKHMIDEISSKISSLQGELREMQGELREKMQEITPLPARSPTEEELLLLEEAKTILEGLQFSDDRVQVLKMITESLLGALKSCSDENSRAQLKELLRQLADMAENEGGRVVG